MRSHERGEGAALISAPPIKLGYCSKRSTALFSSSGTAPDGVFYDAPELSLHKGSPWLNAYLKQRFGLCLEPPQEEAGPRPGDALDIPAALLGRHAVICGASGSGKTRLALHLLREQLRFGCSAVVLDFKEETVRQVLACAQDAGLHPEQITVLWPQKAEHGVPGWNPFACDPASARQAVRQFVSIIEAGSTSWGPRLQDVLTNAATVIAGQRLSLLELTRFLQNEAYREGLLARAHSTAAWKAFREEHEYFASEFAFLSKSEQAGAVAPVLNKIRSLVSSNYLRALLCAREDTLDLPSLWQRQRLVIVHLDTWALGADGTRLLSGMLAHSLFHTAMRRSGPVPVVLSLDELGMGERFVGAAIQDILAMARSQNLRMLAACQHLDQLSEGLKTALLSNTALRAFFRLGPDDARRVAASLSTGQGSRLSRVSISVTRQGKYNPPEMESVRHFVTDTKDQPLAVSPMAWEEFCRIQVTTMNSEKEEPKLLKALSVLMQVSWIPRAYVRVPGSKERYELCEYLKGLPGNAFYFTGPAPLLLVIRFPRPKLNILEQKGEDEQIRTVTKALMELPVQEAVVRTDKGITVRIRVADVSFPASLPHVSAYLANGQSADLIETTDLERREEIAAVSGAPAKDAGPDTNSKASAPSPQKPKSAARPTATSSAIATPAASNGGTAANVAAPTRTERRTSKKQTVGSVPTPPARPLPLEPEVAADGSL